MSEVLAMARIRARNDFQDTITRAGLAQTELARAAGVGERTIYAMTNPAARAARGGYARPVTAWKVARAFAAHLGITPDDAFQALFEETE